MKRSFLELLLVGALVLFFGCAEEQKQELAFFYQNVCVSCDETETMESLATRIRELGRTSESLSATVYEISFESARRALEERATIRGLEPRDFTVPILFVGDETYQGKTEIIAYLDRTETE